MGGKILALGPKMGKFWIVGPNVGKLLGFCLNVDTCASSHGACENEKPDKLIKGYTVYYRP